MRELSNTPQLSTTEDTGDTEVKTVQVFFSVSSASTVVESVSFVSFVLIQLHEMSKTSPS